MFLYASHYLLHGYPPLWNPVQKIVTCTGCGLGYFQTDCQYLYFSAQSSYEHLHVELSLSSFVPVSCVGQYLI